MLMFGQIIIKKNTVCFNFYTPTCTHLAFSVGPLRVNHPVCEDLVRTLWRVKIVPTCASGTYHGEIALLCTLFVLRPFFPIMVAAYYGQPAFNDFSRMYSDVLCMRPCAEKNEDENREWGVCLWCTRHIRGTDPRETMGFYYSG